MPQQAGVIANTGSQTQKPPRLGPIRNRMSDHGRQIPPKFRNNLTEHVLGQIKSLKVLSLSHSYSHKNLEF